jgi:hypothetical protein
MSIPTPKPPDIYHYNWDSQTKINVNYNGKTITLVLDNPNQQNNKMINYDDIGCEKFGSFNHKTNTLLHGQYCFYENTIYEIKNYMFGIYISSLSKPIQPFILPDKIYKYIDWQFLFFQLFHVENKPLLNWLLYSSLFISYIHERHNYLTSKFEKYSIQFYKPDTY